jgi:transcriptional regulator with XRE-family HTH domain
MSRELLGRRIRFLRKAKGLSQEQLGEKSGVNYKYIGELERGVKNPSFDVMIKIAKALEVTLPELVDIASENLSRKELEKQIASVFPRLDENILRAILRSLKELSGK